MCPFRWRTSNCVLVGMPPEIHACCGIRRGFWEALAGRSRWRWSECGLGEVSAQSLASAERSAFLRAHLACPRARTICAAMSAIAGASLIAQARFSGQAPPQGTGPPHRGEALTCPALNNVLELHSPETAAGPDQGRLFNRSRTGWNSGRYIPIPLGGHRVVTAIAADVPHSVFLD